MISKLPSMMLLKSVRNEICIQFQNLRQQHDAILLEKQMDILKQLELNEQSLLLQVENDLRPLEQSKLEITTKNYDLNRKNEPELINLLSTADDIRSRLTQKFAEHHAHINSIEISLQYDQNQIDQINQMCNNIRLNVGTSTTNGNDNNTVSFKPPKIKFDRITMTLRTFLGQDFKCRVTLDQTVFQLKEILGKQEKIDPNQIILSKIGNYFDELDNNRTLDSYNCDSKTVLMVCIRK